MASAFPGNLVADPAYTSGVDAVAGFLSSTLFSMKFYLLFSFLFGYSFTLQLNAAAHQRVVDSSLQVRSCRMGTALAHQCPPTCVAAHPRLGGNAVATGSEPEVASSTVIFQQRRLMRPYAGCVNRR